MALVIIGIGVLAFVDAQAAFQRSNSWSSQAATGMLLANEVREMTMFLPRHDPVLGLSQGWGREDGENALADVNDLDDLDGVRLGLGGTFPGPVNARRGIIPAIDRNGVILEDSDNNAIPMEGWSQRIIVRKVDPYNFLQERAAGYQQAGSASQPTIGADEFPLRVTVIIEYLGPADATAREITSTSWVVPSSVVGSGSAVP